MRNAYTYINFGDFVEGSSSTTAEPYVQLLPLTSDRAEAHSDFLKVRGDSPWTPEDASLLDRVRAQVGEQAWLRISVDLHSCGLSAQTWTAISVRARLVWGSERPEEWLLTDVFVCPQ